MEAWPDGRDAAAESTGMMDDAERRAAELMRAAEEAAATGREMVEEARAVRQRMLDDAMQRRDLVRAELERVRRAIDDALSALDGVEGPRPATSTPEADAGEPEATAETDRRVMDAFAALRKVGDAASGAAAAGTPTEAPAPAPASEADRAPGSKTEPQEPEPTGDDAVRARRDAVLAPLVPDVLRASKRLLQDEQNLVLDAARRAGKGVESSRLLPEPAHHREAWADVLQPGVDLAYSSGRTAVGRRRKPINAPRPVLNELADTFVTPLRERLVATVDDVVGRGPYTSPAELHRELLSAVGARYREWKGGDLEVRLNDALAAAYVRGTYDATPSGAQLRWIPDRAGTCPDCDDNALEPTLKGRHFPTGQSHPPAHPGCRCIVVPVPRDETAESGP